MLNVFTYRSSFLLLVICFLATYSSLAQSKVSGIVVNTHTHEPVSYSTIVWMKDLIGVQTDEDGNFTIDISKKQNDTLVVSYVGYKPFKIAKSDIIEQITLNISLTPTHLSEVAVSSKMTKGYRWWRNIVTRKRKNAPKNYDYFNCEMYNKYEIDVNNIDQYTNLKVLKPFKDKITSIIDSNEVGEKFFPIFFTESISDYYTSSSPNKTRNEVIALKSTGINNESILDYLEEQNQKISPYSNYITLFGKQFISPLHNVADKYYDFLGGDTLINKDGVYYHLLFKPLRTGENVFNGECWVDSSTWAIKKVLLNASATADINYINNIHVEQEYKCNEQKEWLLNKDLLTVKASLFEKGKLSFIAQKTSFFKKVKVNKSFIKKRLDKSNDPHTIIYKYLESESDTSNFDIYRPEALTRSEQKVYDMMDSIKAMPEYNAWRNRFNFLIGGYKKFGPIEIGPWYKWVSGNQIEGLRTRFDFSSTQTLSKKLRLHTYLAYGFKDKRFKGGADARYTFGKDWEIFAGYSDDLYNGRRKYLDGDISIDNIFNRILRRPKIRQKFLNIERSRFRLTKRLPYGISITPTFTQSHYTINWPSKNKRFDYSIFNTDRITNTDISLRLRFAPGERIIDGFRKDIRISRGTLPIVSLDFALSLPKVFNTAYNYQKIDLSITQRFQLSRWGQITYTLYGGKVFGNNIPFMMLEVHPGSEVFYYNKYAFSLMNRYEFFSDRYAGLLYEHNIGKKLLNVLHFLRKTNIRQFYNVKTLWGDASNANKVFNSANTGGYNPRTLNGTAYTEVGTGIDNIFNVMRIDCVWRYNPLLVKSNNTFLNTSKHNFGLLFSFQLQL